MLNLVIVEDEIPLAHVNREFALRAPDVNVVGVFYNGRDALDFLLKNPADLIMLDIGLQKNYSGLDLMADLRFKGKMIDIIMVTGKTDSENIEEAFHLGIVDYLIKPFQYERFLEAIHKCLLRRSLKKKGTYTQADIDRMLTSADNGYGVLPKGLQQKTLDKIVAFMSSAENLERFMTSDYIASEVRLSKVTIQRYMNYLIGENIIISRVNYSTGGRPAIEYTIIKK